MLVLVVALLASRRIGLRLVDVQTALAEQVEARQCAEARLERWSPT
jgi:hypothetical protein